MVSLRASDNINGQMEIAMLVYSKKDLKKVKENGRRKLMLERKITSSLRENT